MRRALPFALLALVLLVVGACGSDEADVGDGRADQARRAALDAGLDPDIADFLALAARGATATYQAAYPGRDGTGEIVVANEPPDRRVDVVVDDEIVQVSLILDGEGFDCLRDEEEDAIVACERTDALVEPPGLFTTAAIEELTTSLGDRAGAYSFRVETTPIAGAEARCLVTELRPGQERPELGSSGTLCVSPEGVLLRVLQGDQELEATEYSTEVPANTFVRPDRQNGDRTNR